MTFYHGEDDILQKKGLSPQFLVHSNFVRFYYPSFVFNRRDDKRFSANFAQTNFTGFAIEHFRFKKRSVGIEKVDRLTACNLGMHHQNAIHYRDADIRHGRILFIQGNSTLRRARL